MATLSVQTIVETGLEPTYATAAGGGDTFPNTGEEFLHVINGSGSDRTVTITPTQTNASNPAYGLLTKSAPAVTVTAGEERMIGPFPQGAYGQSPAITYSGVTSITIAVIKLKKY
jgi:hypothetical protein